MNRVRIVISCNGRWEQLPNGSQRFVGSDNQGMYVSKNMSYEELLSIVHIFGKYDVNKYNVDLQSISIVPGATCLTFVRNDNDVQFMLGEDRVIPQNIEPNLGPNQKVDNEANIDLVDHVENTDEDHVQIQRRGRRVEGVSYTGADMPVLPRSITLVAEEPTSMIYKVQFFSTKKDLKILVGLFAMRRNLEWKVKRFNKTTLHLVCLIDNCTWKLRAVRKDEGTYFQVRSFVNEHSCPLEEIHYRHRQASAVIIGEMVTPRLQQQDGRLMRPKDIITDMKTMYGIQIMYSNAHQALHYALSLTYGTHEETFQLLLSFGYVLEQQNPGTITDLQCADDNKFL
ncbi:hypothetical protein Dsin_001134 [Dipteronia sinensis]|uniref:Transposase MuDR plant domain-containing protein n=1 Tax=Dipteronia sinensis TaxID=43782 RepID=A0AAE0EI34_9ROSI|nr:hypothetical protein Dsin_001134 [Dipteronia sinensis]